MSGAIDLTVGSTPSTPAGGDATVFASGSKHLSTVDDTGLALDFVTGPAVYSNSPSNPTGTTDTTGKMMGLAGSITPAFSGRVYFCITGNLTSSAAADGAACQLTYGTGSAPANAGALTGTTDGTVATLTAAGTNNNKYPFTCCAVVTGLTLATAYWFDLRLKAITAGTAAITDIKMTAFEV